MRWFWIILSLLFAVACGEPNSINERGGHFTDEVEQKAETESPAFLLDANGLKSRFREVFGEELPRGQAWLDALKKRVNGFRYQGEFIPFHSRTFFSPEEEADFGTYNIWANRSSPSSTSRLQTKRISGLTQSYMRSLRAFLADACRQQYLKEAAGGLPKVLTQIDGQAPSIHKVNGFLTLMFGYPSGDSPHEGAKEYQKLLEEGHKQNEDLEEVYVSYCIAVGQDQRTFVR